MDLRQIQLPQDRKRRVYVPYYKDPILAVNHGGAGWYGLMAYNRDGNPMCHECGTFWPSLGNHVRSHGLTARAYKRKYGLLYKTSLSSNTHREKMKEVATERMAKPEARAALIQRCRKLPKPTGSKHNTRLVTELVNRHDTCRAQLLRRLADCADAHDGDVSALDVRGLSTTLVGLLQREFGSFNNAKALLNLTLNRPGAETKLTVGMVAQDALAFHSTHGRWPEMGDYRSRLLLCSDTTIRNRFGLDNVIAAAKALQAKEMARQERADSIQRRAVEIEMEFATGTEGQCQ